MFSDEDKKVADEACAEVAEQVEDAIGAAADEVAAAVDDAAQAVVDAAESVRAKATLVDIDDEEGAEPAIDADAVDSDPVSDSREGKVPNAAVDAMAALGEVFEKFADAAGKLGGAAAEAMTTGAEQVRRAMTDPEGPVQSAAKAASDQVSESVGEPARRKRFAQVGADLFASGSVTSHGGNLSETDGEWIWISRTNSMLGHIDRGDVIRTTWDPSEADIDCSRELIVHRAIYHALAELHEEAGQEFTGAAIVHAHTTNTIFRSLIEDEIELTESESKYTLDGPVKVFAPAVSISSPEAAEMLAGAVREGAKIAVLRGHGPFAVADDMFGAQRLVSVLEQAAKIANLRDATGKAFL